MRKPVPAIVQEAFQRALSRPATQKKAPKGVLA